MTTTRTRIASVRRTAAWDAFAHGLRRDLVAWLAVMAVLSAYRCVMAWPDIRGGAPWDVLDALWTGARFDSVIATIVIMPSLVAGLLAWLAGRSLDAQPLRASVLWTFFVVTALVYAANYQFYQVFGTQIDQRVMAILTDTDGAVRSTIWQAHRPLLFLGLALAAGVLAALATLALIRRTPAGRPSGLRSAPAQWLIVITLVPLVVGLVRGFAWGTSPIRVRNAYVSQSQSLNRLIPSPYAFWLHAMEDLSSDRSAPDAADLAGALDVVDEALGLPAGRGTDIAARLAQPAPGATSPPRHIFLILLEGQHGFPLLGKYRSWGFYPGLSQLADEGAWFDHFIPSGRQTDNTLGALVAGTLSPGFVILAESGAHRVLPTSVAPQFAALGYATHFFYGGYAGWQRLDEFVLPQGFQHLHTAGEMPGKPGNSWGVWDGYLFDDVLARIDPATPSFSLILTTNNHSPFSVDPQLLPELPPLPDAARDWDAATLNVLRHEIYVDREVTRFVRAASQRFPDALFVITGDHTAYGPNYVLPDATALERMTVPLIFTGPALPAQLRGLHGEPAAHLDIPPTLLGLSAPQGFRYRSMGRDLFAPGGTHQALGQDKVLIDGWLAGATDTETSALGAATAPPAAALDLARRYHQAVRSISRAMIFAPTATTD